MSLDTSFNIIIPYAARDEKNFVYLLFIIINKPLYVLKSCVYFYLANGLTKRQDN